jgi:GNAT superfamily N-acetyltransferase
MITFKHFTNEDVSALTPLMKRAFDEDTRIHLSEPTGGPEGYDDGSFLKKWFLHPNASAYTIYDDETLIGGINLWIKPDHHNFLGCLFLDTAYENKGYGTRIWKQIEAMYPETVVWRTETPVFSKRNHVFYINKCGFKCIRIDHPRDVRNGSYILEKDMRTPGMKLKEK